MGFHVSLGECINSLRSLYMLYPRAPSYLNSGLLGCVTIGYIEPSSHYLGNWSPRVNCLRNLEP